MTDATLSSVFEAAEEPPRSSSRGALAVQAGALLTPTRTSVVNDPASAQVLPPTFPEALGYILGHSNPVVLANLPEGVALTKPLHQALIELYWPADTKNG